MTELEQMRAENLQLLQKLVEIDSICECEGMPAQRHCWKMAEIATGRPSPEQTARLAKRVELMEKVVLEAHRTVEDYKGSTALTKALDALDAEDK